MTGIQSWKIARCSSCKRERTHYRITVWKCIGRLPKARSQKCGPRVNQVVAATSK